MKHLSILVPKGTAIVDTIIGTYNQFKMANAFLKQKSIVKEENFDIDLVGLDKEVHTFSRFFSINPTKTIDEIEKTDLIIIPGFVGDLDKQIEKNYGFVEWIKQQRIQHDAEIASLCRGAFLLAETGLLNGKSCATHWVTHDTFARKYPQVELLPDKIINEDNGIYSSGGAYSFLNLLLHLVEKFYGRETAIYCSKMSEIEMDRMSQNQFVIFSGQKDHSDEAIKFIQEYVEANYSEKLSVEHLAHKAAISSRNFVRRFKKATFNTPIEYIQRVRVEAAKKRLESSTLNVNQVMYKSGYSDVKAFRTVFKKYTGLTPLEYRSKYNREMAMV
ncbi:MAG: helix-turn-helix domain-containing protein [Cyanothece sp. SIO1E1]|nr:helix-turn-helix domain-containing protein [Cyanothece sp. SIO1E1]